MAEAGIALVSEASRRLACGQIPQSQRLVPRARQGELTVARHDNISDKVSVTMERALCMTDAALARVLIRRLQLPHDDLLVYTGVFAFTDKQKAITHRATTRE